MALLHKCQKLDIRNFLQKTLTRCLQDLGPSVSISEVLKECEELSPRHWGALESGLHASVYALGCAKPVGRLRSIFTVATWCNIAKMVVIIDSFRYMLQVPLHI